MDNAVVRKAKKEYYYLGWARTFFDGHVGTVVNNCGIVACVHDPILHVGMAKLTGTGAQENPKMRAMQFIIMAVTVPKASGTVQHVSMKSGTAQHNLAHDTANENTSWR